MKVSRSVLKTRGFGDSLAEFNRSAHDAQKLLQLNLRSDRGAKEKRVLELDIEKYFDRISHTSIMERLIAPQGIKTGIYRGLKANTVHLRLKFM